MRFVYVRVSHQGGDSQNFLRKFVRFFGPKILRLFKLKVLFEADIFKGGVNYCTNHKLPIFYD